MRAYKSREFHTWTEGEIEQFEERWSIGNRERLAFDLLLYTGQPWSCAMARPSLGEKIRVAQQKTGAKLAISVHPNLRRSLDACPSGHVAAIATVYGRPFSVKGFGQFVANAIRKAALPTHCKAHGLRKAAARRLAEAKCTLHEIAVVTGTRPFERSSVIRGPHRRKSSTQARLRNRPRTNKWQPCRSELATPLKNKDKLCRLAVPRGLRQSNSFNKLQPSGTPKHPTGSLAFLSAVSHSEGRNNCLNQRSW